MKISRIYPFFQAVRHLHRYICQHNNWQILSFIWEITLMMSYGKIYQMCNQPNSILRVEAFLSILMEHLLCSLSFPKHIYWVFNADVKRWDLIQSSFTITRLPVVDRLIISLRIFFLVYKDALNIVTCLDWFRTTVARVEPISYIFSVNKLNLQTLNFMSN